ncbi:MAG: autotransporter outer membrane beta-barrel domain-containing protein [Oligoflexia bacterium]|nr:autotransporter outer membrane beta-barrel domain-containing protein [Oligoflexia bacterium]
MRLFAREKPRWKLCQAALLGGALLHAELGAAKAVNVQWKKIPDATQYELEVKNAANEVVAKRLSEETSWKGDLPPGIYAYQLRGHDWMKRPGKWSPPKALVVMPPAPETLEPKSGETLPTFAATASVALRWQPVPLASKYRVKVKRGAQEVFSAMVASDRVTLPRLIPGKYEWSAIPVLEAQPGRAPASLVGKIWEGKAEATSSFELERRQLGKPVPVYPLGIIRPSARGMQEFEWKAVEGATAYRLQAFRILGMNRAQVEVGPPVTIDAKESRALLRLPGEGIYRWKIAAVVKPDSAGAPPLVSQEALGDFQVDRNAVFLPGMGYVATSVMLSPYTYEVISPLADRKFYAAASAAVFRLSGEYWFHQRLGGAVAVENTSFKIDSYSYNRAAVELQLKYRMKLDEDQNGWYFLPKGGLEYRDYFHLIWSGAGSVTATMARSYTQYHALGGSIGFDIRKQFSPSWSIGGKFAYFHPLSLSGGLTGTALTSDASRRNFSFGLQGLYWLKKEWSLAAGVFIDKRSISFQPPTTSAPEKVYSDGTYFFASVIYSFGRGQ